MTNAIQAPASVSPVETVANLALSYLVSRSLFVATELGIADLVKDRPKSAREIAAALGADAGAVYRLLRTLAMHGIFAEDSEGRFASTPASALLQSGVMRDGVLLCGEVTGDGSWWNAAGSLKQAVMSGEPAFDRQHGVGFFEYMRRHPACGEWFDRGLANFAAAENPAIAGAYDFSRFKRIVDVGGGQGGLLAEILARHGAVLATLFDLPQVVAQPAHLEKAAPKERWSAVAGDFFESVPRGGEVYILKRILHDWSDAQCVKLLRRCRDAMDEGTRLLVIDAVIPPGNAAHPGKVMDILMMVFGPGRERTEAETGALLQQAGLRRTATLATPSTLGIIEAVRA
jgi:hypothetical protein